MNDPTGVNRLQPRPSHEGVADPKGLGLDQFEEVLVPLGGVDLGVGLRVEMSEDVELSVDGFFGFPFEGEVVDGKVEGRVGETRGWEGESRVLKESVGRRRRKGEVEIPHEVKT